MENDRERPLKETECMRKCTVMVLETFTPSLQVQVLLNPYRRFSNSIAHRIIPRLQIHARIQPCLITKAHNVSRSVTAGVGSNRVPQSWEVPLTMQCPNFVGQSSEFLTLVLMHPSLPQSLLTLYNPSSTLIPWSLF